MPKYIHVNMLKKFFLHKQTVDEFQSSSSNDSNNVSSGTKRSLEDSASEEDGRTPVIKKVAYNDELSQSYEDNISGPKNFVIEEYYVPDDKVELLTCNAQEQLNYITKKTLCQIQFASGSNGSCKRPCTLIGSEKSVEAAKEMIEEIIAQAESPVLSEPIQVDVRIPMNKVGLLFMKQGEDFRNFIQKYSVKIAFIQDGCQPPTEVKPLRVSGEPQKINIRLEGEAKYVKHAKQMIWNILAQNDDELGIRKPKKNAKKYIFEEEIMCMMQSLGDVKANRYSARLIHEIVLDDMKFLLGAANDVLIEFQRNMKPKTISHVEILFLMRSNKIKIKRLLKYLQVMDLAPGYNHILNSNEVQDIEDSSKSYKNQCLEFLATIEQRKEFTSLLKDTTIVDEAAIRRLERRMIVTTFMTEKQYVIFSKKISLASFSPFQHTHKFKAWLLKHFSNKFEITPLALIILVFLARETVAEIVDMVFHMRTVDTKILKELYEYPSNNNEEIVKNIKSSPLEKSPLLKCEFPELRENIDDVIESVETLLGIDKLSTKISSVLQYSTQNPVDTSGRFLIFSNPTDLSNENSLCTEDKSDNGFKTDEIQENRIEMDASDNDASKTLHISDETKYSDISQETPAEYQIDTGSFDIDPAVDARLSICAKMADFMQNLDYKHKEHLKELQKLDKPAYFRFLKDYACTVESDGITPEEVIKAYNQFQINHKPFIYFGNKLHRRQEILCLCNAADHGRMYKFKD